MPHDYMKTHAEISHDLVHRFRLWREWKWGPGDMHEGVNWTGGDFGDPLALVVVGLNPSTADTSRDDPTIRRCVSFAKALGFFRLEMLNLFAYRATNPQVILKAPASLDVVGAENEFHVGRTMDRAGMILCAWGAHGGHLGQDETMLGWLQALNWRSAPIVALGVTKDGFPRHPLYVPGGTVPQPYTGRKSPEEAAAALGDSPAGGWHELAAHRVYRGPFVPLVVVDP